MIGKGFSFIAGGDIMLGEHPIMIGRGVATKLLNEPNFNPLAEIKTQLAAADLALGNLECALATPRPGASAPERECVGPEIGISCLKDSGFDAFTVANNHSQQHGTGPFHNTCSMLAENQLTVVGKAGPVEGSCCPADVEINGHAVRLLGYSLRPRQHFDEYPDYAEGTTEGMLSDIRAGKEAGKIVIVAMHWGDEFVVRPSTDQVALGRSLIDAGATLIVGHHPHVLQGWERYKNGAIIYSLGNLVFDMPWLPELKKSALFSCVISSEGISDVDWTPLELDQNHCPKPAVEPVAGEILDFLWQSDKDLTNQTGLWSAPAPAEYSVLLSAAAAKQRKACHMFFLNNFFKYEPSVLYSILSKFALRRVGLLKD